MCNSYFTFQAIIPDSKSEDGKGQSSFAKPQAPHAKAFQSLYSLLGYNEQVITTLTKFCYSRNILLLSIEIRSNVYVISHFIFQEHRFTTMPHKIRCAPAVNSFFSNMSQVSTILIGIFVRRKLLHINCSLK